MSNLSNNDVEGLDLGQTSNPSLCNGQIFPVFQNIMMMMMMMTDPHPSIYEEYELEGVSFINNLRS